MTGIARTPPHFSGVQSSSTDDPQTRFNPVVRLKAPAAKKPVILRLRAENHLRLLLGNPEMPTTSRHALGAPTSDYWI
jgi:hypothetical protein